MDIRLIFLCLSFLISKSVFGDEVKSVSVMEGESVTLHTDVIKEKDDLIVWHYGPENTFIARLNGKASSSMLSDDERYRDKLKLNDQTGDLTITNLTTNHSGLYQLKISSNNKVSYKKFNVTVRHEVKSVSVMEGHCVTLHTDVTHIQTDDDKIEWMFGSEVVAVINGKANRTILSDDERFRDRLKRDDQTGALMINDTRTDHSGLYQLMINNNNTVSYEKFYVTVSGVFTGDEVKSVSVREGHSVILYTHVLKQSNDVIEWKFGHENILVAKINGMAGTTRLSDDKRFRGRVKVDDSTGALMINDITANHTGLYQVRINSNNKVSYKRFDVTIHDSRVLWVWVIPVALLICVCICVGFCVQKHRDPMKTLHAPMTKDDKSSLNSSTTLIAEASRFPSSNNVKHDTEDEKKT